MPTNQQPPKTVTDIVKPELPSLMAIVSLTNTNENDQIQTLVLQELNYLEQHALAKPEIVSCHPASIVLAVKSTMRKNLTLDPSAGLTYVKTRNMQVEGKWVQVLEVQDTANGKLSYNRQLGRILDFTRPKVTKNEKGRVIGVSMRLLLPSYGAPRWEDYEYDESDFKRWAKYSHKERARGYKQGSGKPEPNIDTLNYANELYRSHEGGIDPEFARAKCINHSVKKLGANPNEAFKLIPVNNSDVAVIDPQTAVAEAQDENGDFAWHEEVNSQVNDNANTQTEQPATDTTDNDFANNL